MTRFLTSLATVCLPLACAFQATPSANDPGLVEELGEPSDEVDPEVIGAVVRENSRLFQSCYESAREENPSLEGRVEIRFLIQTDGSVHLPQAVETNLPSNVVGCVVNVFHSLQLPQQESAVIAQYPMFFQPS